MKKNKNKILKIFNELKKIDTPTICNALELLDSNCQKDGYTKKHFICLNKNLKPIIGFARTAKIESNLKKGIKNTSEETANYYKYMNTENIPKICLIEDINKKPTGSFWGEVQTNIHKKIGFEGVITNGAMRDIDQIAKNFQILSGLILPSHAFIKLKNLGRRIRINNQYFEHNDIIHADQHGAVKIPYKHLFNLPKAIKQIYKNEKPILNLCKSNKFSIQQLNKILNLKDKYH